MRPWHAIALLVVGFGIGFGSGASFMRPAAAAPALRLNMPPGSWPVELTVHDVDGSPVRMRFACTGETR